MILQAVDFNNLEMKKLFVTLLLFTFFIAVQAQVTDEIITLSTPTGDLKGTLVLPNYGKHFNLVILQPGSGPTDRNGNNPMGIKANSYRLLAEALAKKNIATLLMDKRGIAASALAAKSEADLRFDDYINDLEGWADWMKKDKRFKKITLAGHSEGSLIAMVAAQKISIDNYISISGISQPIENIITWQISQQAPKLAPIVDSLFLRLKLGEKLDSVPPYLFSVLSPSVQPYMASWMKYNPCNEIKKLTLPVLIIQGTTDIQVKTEEAEKLHECNPQTSLIIIAGMNHILKKAPEDRTQNMQTYSDEKLPVMPELVNAIADFIK